MAAPGAITTTRTGDGRRRAGSHARTARAPDSPERSRGPAQPPACPTT
jgi:hypothetical protein